MKKLPPLTHELSLSTWVELMKAFHRIRTHELPLIEAYGLSIGQFALLELLYHRGEQSIGAATRLVMSTPGNMTVVVKNLTRHGLITLTPHPDDRRSTLLRITPQGASILDAIFPQHSEQIASAFHGLDEEEQRTLRHLLRKINTTLRSSS